MKKIAPIVITVLVVGGMVALLAYNKKKMNAETTSTIQSEKRVAVSTITVEEENYSLEFTSNGIVQAVSELNFVSNVQGRVTAIYADNGKFVRQGEPLLKIESELLESDYNAALAAYEAMSQDVQRFTNSNKAGGVTDQQLDNMKTQLAAAKSRLDRSRKMFEDAVVKSPMTGVINSRYVELGSLIAPNAPLFDIVNDTRLKMTVGVSEGRVKMLSKGQKVSLTGSVAGKKYSGTVNFIGIKTDRGLNYPVEIYLDRDDDIQIGMYLKVLFSENTAHTGLLVPRKAIVGSAKAANVYLVQNDRAVRREVVLGEMTGDKVEILSGISAGDEIITAGIMNVADGTELTRVK